MTVLLITADQDRKGEKSLYQEGSGSSSPWLMNMARRPQYPVHGISDARVVVMACLSGSRSGLGMGVLELGVKEAREVSSFVECFDEGPRRMC